MSTAGLTVSDRWRKKISQSNMLDDLIMFAEGRLPFEQMPAHRANVILKLLGKFLPDLQAAAIEIRVTGDNLNRLELEARANILGVNVDNLWNDVNNQSVIEHEPVNQEEPINTEVEDTNTNT